MNTLIKYFRRNDVVKLTGLSLSKIDNYSKTKLITPIKKGGKVFFTYNQVLELKIISKLNKVVSLQEIRKVIAFLEEINCKQSISSLNLTFTVNNVFYKPVNCDYCMNLTGKNKGEFNINVLDISKEIEDGIKTNNIVDFFKVSGYRLVS